MNGWAGVNAVFVFAAVFSPICTQGTTWTWDGGGSTSNFSDAQNWVSDTAPPNDLANTDLVFTGYQHSSPVVNSPSQVHSLTFSPQADYFSFSGGTLSVGASITNNNYVAGVNFLDLVAFNNEAVATISAASNDIDFSNGIILPSERLQITGSHLVAVSGNLF